MVTNIYNVITAYFAEDTSKNVLEDVIKELEHNIPTAHVDIIGDDPTDGCIIEVRNGNVMPEKDFTKKVWAILEKYK